jgi:hypothetical protein
MAIDLGCKSLSLVFPANLYPDDIDRIILPGYIKAMSPISRFTAFEGHRRLTSGPLHEVALRVKEAIESGAGDPVFIYDDTTGRAIDVDMRGTDEQIVERLLPAAELRGRGRPKLGVVAREVTLLPRHWDWLSTQPGGASVAIRKLVEEARRNSGARDRNRAAQEAAYHFMSALAGDLPGFEEASRALFANDRRRFSELLAAWPEDVRDHAIMLAFADLDPNSNQ